MSTKQLYFVSSNMNKFFELRALIRGDVRIDAKSVEVPEIQSLDVAEVARDKAEKAYKLVRMPLIVEDTGLYIKALGGFPGALVKWILRPDGADKGNRRICGMVPDADRRAYSETAIAFCDGGSLKVFTGRTYGTISKAPEGGLDFGWGPVFIPRGHDLTFGQMGTISKNKVSSRGKAAEKLNRYLAGKQ